MPKSVKKHTRMKDQSSDDEDDAVEMEKNFALLSQRGAMQTSAEDEEEYFEDEDEEEGPEEDGDDEEVSGSDDDKLDSAPEEAFKEEGSTYMKSHTKGDIKIDLSSMSFEEIMKLQNKVGTKAYNKIAYGATKQKQQNTEPKKRLNRHKPQEISAKKRVPYIRQVVPVKKNISRDPRFDDLSGEYKPEVFHQTYKFIGDLREQEMQMVRKKLKKAKSVEKKEELKALLKRLENQQRARQRQEKEREKELQFKKKLRGMVGQGHKPFYLKKSDKKKMELAEKYSELKKSGKLENFLSKKRKRNATKDRRKLPNQHKAR
ncbi:ribosomal RNA processing protein 36 homolog [Triplophysa rosa]|uniref:rRNA biogenesis protein RRP36 n=1 Tax=Triplophysa rosa TaxID=992332 RepID=A0A9W7T5E5_TRIRA|nr:ribosomal RNA processing protein 36 homolog [Triplophysa rosa]KAI7791037.1 ribosomal RNA processing protein 36-like protein [Triplophysa rosa]